jgi:hypothetical protein
MNYIFCLIVVAAGAIFQLSGDCHPYQGCKYVDLCLALVDFSSEGSFS